MIRYFAILCLSEAVKGIADKCMDNNRSKKYIKIGCTCISVCTVIPAISTLIIQVTEAIGDIE